MIEENKTQDNYKQRMVIEIMELTEKITLLQSFLEKGNVTGEEIELCEMQLKMMIEYQNILRLRLQFYLR